MLQSDSVNQIFDNVATAAATPEKITLWDMALKGGWIMGVLALLLILAIYIFIERYLALRNALRAQSDDAFMGNIRDYIHEGKIKSAQTLCQKIDTPVSRMIEAGVERYGKPDILHAHCCQWAGVAARMISEQTTPIRTEITR